MKNHVQRLKLEAARWEASREARHNLVSEMRDHEIATAEMAVKKASKLMKDAQKSLKLATSAKCKAEQEAGKIDLRLLFSLTISDRMDQTERYLAKVREARADYNIAVHSVEIAKADLASARAALAYARSL